MQNRQQPPQDNAFEQGEYLIPPMEFDTVMDTIQEEQKQLEYLLGLGFTWDETRKLQYQRTHAYENVEMQERLEDDSRIHFARWLYEQGEINEK